MTFYVFFEVAFQKNVKNVTQKFKVSESRLSLLHIDVCRPTYRPMYDLSSVKDNETESD